jgi:hypothetical protein
LSMDTLTEWIAVIAIGLVIYCGLELHSYIITFGGMALFVAYAGNKRQH